MKKVLIVFAVVFMLSINSMAQENNPVISIKSKTLGMDQSWNRNNAIINITIDGLGHLVYVEEYYSIDSNGEPKFYSSSRYYEEDIKDRTLSINISRPNTRLGVPYSLIKSVVIINNSMRIEKWLNSTKNIRIENVGKESFPKVYPNNQNSPNVSDNENINKSVESIVPKDSRKNSPGFESLAFIIVIFLLCLLDIKKR